MSLETPFRIEPCLLDTYPAELADLIAEVVGAAEKLGARLHAKTAASLADLVRVMNCYYSNLIEGHNTRPRDIERALSSQLEPEGERRDLQREALAHVRVQRELDRLHADGQLGEPGSAARIRWIHREFYRDAPARMLRIAHANGDFSMIPGEFRSEPKHDNAVGRHQPPSSVHVAAFMAHFEGRYRFETLGRAARVAALAAAHHRLNYIHPFSDGNGRVSRLMSHAMALEAGIGAHGLWAISRGLARGLADAGEYRRMMDVADDPRRGDLDGRGNLSREALVEFVTWFMRVALDQLTYMSALFELDRLGDRLDRYARSITSASDSAAAMVGQVLQRGEVGRGELVSLAGRSERTARAELSKMLQLGLLTSDTPKGPVRLLFSVESAEDLFPRLFPAQLAT